MIEVFDNTAECEGMDIAVMEEPSILDSTTTDNPEIDEVKDIVDELIENVITLNENDSTAVTKSDVIPLENTSSTEKAKKMYKLMAAIRLSNKGLVSSILEETPELAREYDWGGTPPVALALMVRSHDIAALLIEHGGSLRQYDAQHFESTHYAKSDTEVKKLQVLDMKVNSNIDVTEQLTEMELKTLDFRNACYNGELAKVKMMVEEDPSLVHALDNKKQTMLMFACLGTQMETIKFLISQGADWKAKSIEGGKAVDFINDPALRAEFRHAAYWWSPKGRLHQAKIDAKKEKFDRRQRERITRAEMRKEEKEMRKYLEEVEILRRARESIALEMCVGSESTVIGKATAKAEAIIVKRIKDAIAKAAKEARERARREKKEMERLRRERALRIMRRCLTAVFALMHWMALGRHRRLLINARLKEEAEDREWEHQRRMRIRKAKHDKLMEIAREKALLEWEELQLQLKKQEWQQFLSAGKGKLAKVQRMKLGLKKL